MGDPFSLLPSLVVWSGDCRALMQFLSFGCQVGDLFFHRANVFLGKFARVWSLAIMFDSSSPYFRVNFYGEGSFFVLPLFVLTSNFFRTIFGCF